MNQNDYSSELGEEEEDDWEDEPSSGNESDGPLTRGSNYHRIKAEREFKKQ